MRACALRRRRLADQTLPKLGGSLSAAKGDGHTGQLPWRQRWSQLTSIRSRNFAFAKLCVRETACSCAWCGDGWPPMQWFLLVWTGVRVTWRLMGPQSGFCLANANSGIVEVRAQGQLRAESVNSRLRYIAISQESHFGVPIGPRIGVLRTSTHWMRRAKPPLCDSWSRTFTPS